jgi:hypothetical protein
VHPSVNSQGISPPSTAIMTQTSPTFSTVGMKEKSAAMAPQATPNAPEYPTASIHMLTLDEPHPTTFITPKNILK